MTDVVPDLSVVCPVYGTPDPLFELVPGIVQAAEELDVTFEIVLVDDRCPHGSWAVIQKLAKEYPQIVAVRLSRNFGQHPAIFAGLKIARGAKVAVMDSDLQDSPAELPRLYREALKGFEIVRARRVDRQDSWLRRKVSQAFFRSLSYLTAIDYNAEIANFGVYDRKVIDAILSWREDHRFFPAAVQWAGFEHSDVETVHRPRNHGRSNYNFKKLGDLAISVMISFSDKPLRIIALAGLMIAAIMFLLSVVFLMLALFGAFEVAGYASLIISIWFLSGLLLFAIGVCGLYIGQILRESKRRPNVVFDRIERSVEHSASSKNVETTDAGMEE